MCRLSMVALLIGMVAGGCKSNDVSTASPQVKTAGDGASVATAEDRPPFHTSPAGPQHRAEREPPPSAPQRDLPVDEITVENATIKVSDLQIPGGQTRTASIEIHPTGDWKFNPEYPTRVQLDGATVASPSEMHFDSRAKDASGFHVTSGGVRLDIPFTGDAPGSDLIEATIRYGLCNQTSCLARKDRVSWRVEVSSDEVP